MSDQIVTFDAVSLAPSSTVRNLGVMFDKSLQTALFHLHNIGKIMNILYVFFPSHSLSLSFSLSLFASISDSRAAG